MSSPPRAPRGAVSAPLTASSSVRSLSAGRPAVRPLVGVLVASTLVAGGCSDGASPAPTVASTQPVPAAVVHTSTPSSVEAEVAPSWPGRETFDFARHVPDNAIAYFEVRSIKALEEAVLRVQTLTGTPAEQADIALATRPMSMIGIDPARVDRNAPLAIAYAQAPGQFVPTPVVIAPAIDAAAIAEDKWVAPGRGMQSRSIDAGYIVVEHEAMHASVPRGSSPLVHDLPDGLLTGRFASDSFAPLLSVPLSELAEHLNESYRLSRPHTSASHLYEFDANEAIQAIATVDIVAIGLDLDGDRADLRVHVAREDGVVPTRHTIGTVAGTIDDLARFVDPDDPLSMLVAIDEIPTLEDIEAEWREALDATGVEAAQALWPGELAEGTTRDLIADSLDDLRQAFLPGAALSFCLEPAKAHVAIYLSAKQELRAREWVSLLLSRCELENAGFEMALPIRSRVEGILVEDYTVRFDSRTFDFDDRARMRSIFKSFLGDSTLHIKVVTSGRQVLVVLGGDTAAVRTRIRDFEAATRVDPCLDTGLAALEGADSATIAHTDFVKLLGQIAGVVAVASGRSVAETAREIAREVGDAEAPFTFWSGTVGNESVIGTTFDLGALAKTFDAFKGSGL